MIELRHGPHDKIIELGGGQNRNPSCQVNVDVRQGPGVDFVADFDKPLPIKDEEWDGVFSQYVIEHISWRKVRSFLKEVFRILKPGGRVVFVTADTEAQTEWINTNGNGWDGKPLFESASCVIFGDQDYAENSHKNYMNHNIALDLFGGAGFEAVITQPYGERRTDMVITACKPQRTEEPIRPVKGDILVIETEKGLTTKDREDLFDKHYFNGGGKVGGYAREGYWDYPVHEVTLQHVLSRNPTSVLEIGCARGYILKRLQDRGITAYGIEISKHCHMTRVANNVQLQDICKTPWACNLEYRDFLDKYDLAFSIATFEHIPIEHLGDVLLELKRCTNRGLHGIDFGGKDDGFDKTHCTLRPREWWRELFDHYGLAAHEIVDKEELEKGEFPQQLLVGDGKVKLNVGSYTTMFHNGWVNMDIHDLGAFAQNFGYRFQRHDVKTGLPYSTGAVDLIYTSHFLEHLNYVEGLAFLRECRRVLKPSGVIRIAVPDAEMLMHSYDWASRDSEYKKDFTGPSYDLDDYNEINDGCASVPTPAAKLWSLLHEGHSACYDEETLSDVLKRAAITPVLSSFRKPHEESMGMEQISRETLDMFPCLSLYMNGIV